MQLFSFSCLYFHTLFFMQFLLLGLIIISWPVFTENVYKRGALGRPIDMARYSGYAELKQDLARRFGIEGQLEDQQRIGWKLVYMDHDDDVLLVGEDPWEVFANCVRCIKILSLEEVQQMSFIGDFGNPVLPNQAFNKL